MKVLIVDYFYQPRPVAQADMYKVLLRERGCSFIHPHRISEVGDLNQYDVVYMGLFHHRFPFAVGDLLESYSGLVLLDQADNEEFYAERNGSKYEKIKRKLFLSRYLPNESMSKAAMEYDCGIMLLPWYIDASEMKDSPVKDIDVSFISTLYDRRLTIAETIREVCRKNNLNYQIGEVFGWDYLSLIGRTKIFIAECKRKCLTQKFIEASFSGAIVVGDVPIYPHGDYGVIEAPMESEEGIGEVILSLLGNKDEFARIIKRQRSGMARFTDKEFFLSQFDKAVNYGM